MEFNFFVRNEMKRALLHCQKLWQFDEKYHFINKEKRLKDKKCLKKVNELLCTICLFTTTFYLIL